MGQGRATDLLLELLVDDVECVLDRDAFGVTGGHFKSEGEVEVDLLDWGVDEEHFENVFVLDGVWGGVEFPGFKVD